MTTTAPTAEALAALSRAAALLQMRAAGTYIAPITNIFGETQDGESQIADAKATIARFASVYC